MKAILFSVSFSVLLLVASAARALTLDDFINRLKEDKKHSPFVRGEVRSEQREIYQDLVLFGLLFKTDIRWVPSVAKSVLELPPHKDRMLVTPKNKFDGWFDEFVQPNLVLIDDQAPMIILVHELRHAVQLGSHGLTMGTWFDRTLQKNKRRILRFHQKVEKSDLPETTKEQLKKLSTRLVETCSEISAHEGDVVLSRAFKRWEGDSYAQYIQEYKDEFDGAFQKLRRDPFSRDELFVADLNFALKKFMKEKGL